MSEEYEYGIGYIGPTNANPNQVSIRVESSLSKDEFLEIEQACENVHGVTGSRQFVIVQKNYQRIINTVAFYENAVINRTLSDSFNHRSIVDNLSVDIINWLTSTRLFLDHHLTALAHKYGKDSNERQRFIQATNTEYDSVPAYRVLYKLRDYTQHCGFPVDSITMTARNPNEDDWTAFVTLSANRDELLENFDWKSKVRDDLLEMDEAIDIPSLIKQAQPCFRRIFAELLRIRLSTSQESVCKVREAAARCESVTARKYLIKTTIVDGVPTNVTQTPLPVEICDWIEDSTALDRYMNRLLGDSNSNPEVQLAAPGLTPRTQELLRIGARVRAGYFSAGGLNPQFSAATDQIIAAEGDVLAVLAGTIILCGMGTAMAGAALGTAPQDVIGGIVASLDDA
jgi:hypothetical protein